MADTPLYIPYFRDNDTWIDYRKDIKGNSFTWAWERATTDIQYLAIHHSVTRVRDTWSGKDGAKKYADEIAKIHVDGNGWGGVGYHFIVAPHPKQNSAYLLYVGDVSTARANIRSHNEKVIGICMVGDFTRHLPTDGQIRAMHELTTWFDGQRATWPNLKSPWDAMVQGHKVLHAALGQSPTACPGSSWPIDMKDRIKNNVVYTPQPPEPPTTPPTEPEPEPPGELPELGQGYS